MNPHPTPALSATATATPGIPRWLLAGIAVLSLIVALVSYRYLSPAADIPDQIQGNRYLHPWLLIHAVAAATALLTGPVQLSRSLRRYWPLLHRWIGRIYVLGCVGGGVSGLLLAIGASAGPLTALGFGALALAWLVSTGMGWLRALERRMAEHQAWMIRSLALTLAAVSLRIYLPLAQLLQLPSASSYAAIAWLCWVPNLLLAEYYLRRRKRHC